MRCICLILCACLLASCASNAPEPEQGEFGNAQWLWKSQSLDSNDWGAFKRQFMLEDVPATAEIRIACDSKYSLWVNGEQVISDGGLKRGPNGVDTYYDMVDIAPWLMEGKNDLSVLVWYWGTHLDTTHYESAGQPGLILAADFKDTATRKKVSTGDGRWYASAAGGYTTGKKSKSFYLAEMPVEFDARYSEGWMSPDYDPVKNGWEKAVTLARAGEAPWNALVKRPIPQFRNQELTRIEYSGDNEIRLPYNTQLFPYLELGDGTAEGCTIRVYTETSALSTLDLQYTTKAGSQTFESPAWLNGDYLYFDIPEGVEVRYLGYRETGYAADFSGSFAGKADTAGFTGGWYGESSFYAELWKKAARSLYVCMRDTYMDCPDRERGQYIGDALTEMEMAFYALGPEANPLSANAIRQICAGQFSYRKNGRTYYAMSSLEPIVTAHEIPIQELGTAVAAWEYYLYTGDKSLIQDTYRAMYLYLTNYEFEEEGRYAGTIQMRSNDTFTEKSVSRISPLTQWSDWGYNQDSRISVNCWWYMSAVSVRKMMQVEGVELSQEELTWLDEGISRVQENFRKFWNDSLGAYATDWGNAWNAPLEQADDTHLVDERVNALAVISGLAEVSKYPQLRSVFQKYENASIYMEKYVLEALYQMGYAQDAMQRMEKRYLEIVNDENSSTLPELWSDAGVADFSSYAGTKNHGWSGGPLTLLGKYAAGVEPLTAGWESWHVLPRMGSFTELSAVVPSQIGPIAVSIQNESMTVESPGETCFIYVPFQPKNAPENVTVLSTETVGGACYFVYRAEEAGSYTFE